jgi:hypothetical protein
MYFPRIALTAIGAVILLPSALPQNSCPLGQREHKADNGTAWCIDSEGRSYAAETKREANQPNRSEESSLSASQGHSYGVVNLPRTIHLCAAGFCQTLTWNDGHYDSRVDGQTEVGTLYAIVRWDREAVEFVGIVPKPDAAGSYITGIFTGKISPTGNSLDNGIFTSRVGSATGSAPFTLSWNSSDPSNAVPPRSQNLPSSFRMCGGPCSTQRLNGGQYEAYMEDTGNSTLAATYTVATLSPELAFFNIELTNGYRGIILGRVQGNALVDGKLTWLNCYNGDTLRVRAAWGDEMASITPGPIVSVRQQQTFQPSGQQQINPWLLLFGAVLGGTLMDGDGDHYNPDDVNCAADYKHLKSGCINEGRAAQIHKSMQPH